MDINFPRSIPLNPIFDISCNVSVDSETALVTWLLLVPIDKEKYLSGKSIIECISECFPDINGNNISDYVGNITQVPIP
jgi:hypothetical protein